MSSQRPPCNRFTPHLWKEGRCACLAKKEAHSESALQPLVPDDAPPAVWYVRPSEMMRQQGRLRHQSSGSLPRPSDASAAAGAGNTTAQPAAPYARTRASLRRVAQSVDWVMQRQRAPSAMSPSSAISDMTGESRPRTVSDLARAFGEPIPLRRTSRLSSPPDVGRESGESSAAEGGPTPSRSTNPSPGVGPPLGKVEALLEHFDGSMSSRIMDRARSPPPILHHEGGAKKQAGTAASQAAAAAAAEDDGAEEDEGYDDDVRSQQSSHDEDAHEDEDEDDDVEEKGSEELSATSSTSAHGHTRDSSEPPPADAVHTDDDDPTTESGMSTHEIQQLLTRLAPTAPVLPVGAAAAARSASGATLPLKGILRVKRRSSSRGTAPASSGSSGGGGTATAPRSKRTPRSKAPTSPRRCVSFNSMVRVRELGRMQGGSTSVTRSGAYSLGLDWVVQRESVAPLELAIDTIAERRRKIEEAVEEGGGDPSAPSTAAAAAASTLLLVAEEDEDTLVLIESESSDEPVPVPSPVRASPLTVDMAGGGGAVCLSPYSPSAQSLLDHRRLRVHRRYPSNNKDEELQRISEEGRMRLFRNYVSTGLSLPPTPSLSPSASMGAGGLSDHHEGLSSSISSSSLQLLVVPEEDVPPAALAAVLADPREWDEGAELELIRESRGGNFCSCHPPRGRKGAMNFLNLGREAVDALPLSADNTCCSDDSCACFRAGVGCHVELDHYCSCAGSFVELIPQRRKSLPRWDDEGNLMDEDDNEEEGGGGSDDPCSSDEDAGGQQDDNDDNDNDDDDDGDRPSHTPKPLPLAQAGCLNPAGRYQFDQRAAGDHVQKFLYTDPYADDSDLADAALTSPPVRVSRAHTPFSVVLAEPIAAVAPTSSEPAADPTISTADPAVDPAASSADAPAAVKRATFAPHLLADE